MSCQSITFQRLSYERFLIASKWVQLTSMNLANFDLICKLLELVVNLSLFDYIPEGFVVKVGFREL